MILPPRVRSSSALPFSHRFVMRAALIAFLWFGLNGTDWNSWIIGAPAVFAAAWISARLMPSGSWNISLWGAIVFAVVFLRGSIRGGWDVARRALSPKLQLEPALIQYKSRLPKGTARMLFCSVLTVLPGTAVVAMSDGFIRIHVLDLSPAVELELHDLEQRIADMFGHALQGNTEVST